VRLGIPLVVYFFVINPLTIYAAYRAENPSFGFEPFLRMCFTGLRGMGTGPLWFIQVLLAFSILTALVAAVVPAAARKAARTGEPRPLRPGPTFLALIGLGLGVGAISFAVRLRFPIGAAVSNLQLGNFTQYIVFYVLGIAVNRRDFLERFAALSPRPWYWGALACLIALQVVLVTGGAFQRGLDAYLGGMRWQALACALWEQVTAVVFSMALLAFARRRMNSPGPVARIAARNAYTIYVFHAPAIVWIAYAGLRLHLPPAVKWVLLVVAGCAVTVLLGELVLRRIPGVRRVMS